MEKKNFSSNLKLGKFKSLLDNLNSDQRDLVKSCGFGTILDFDCSEAPRSVSFWLAKRFDVQTRTVNLQNGSSFVINPYTVHQILGIPLGGRKIPTRATKHVKDIIGNDTGTASIAPTVDQLFGLVNNELSGDKFVRVFMLIALAIFLCPTSYGSASSHYYSAIASVKDIPKYDWCSFVLDWLVTSVEKFQESAAKGNALGKDKTSSLGGCLFVLAVTYFEYIDTTQILLRDDIPRLKIWDDYMIQEFLALDGNSGDGRSFGMLQLKDVSETPFLVASISSASFSRLPAKVEDFIMRLIPNDEHQNLRDELSDMCRSFYKEIMGSSLAAIQPVIINQMCRMVTTMWDAMSKKMPDRRYTDVNNLHVPTHTVSSRDGNNTSGTHVDIGMSAEGGENAARHVDMETETQLPSDPHPQSGGLQHGGNTTKTPADINTSPLVQLGISPNIQNVDSVSKDCSRSPSTIYCAQVFKYNYDESTSNLNNNATNRVTHACEDSLQNKRNALYQSFCNSSAHINDTYFGGYSGTPANKAGSNTRPCVGSSVHDTSMRSYNISARAVTNVGPALNFMDDTGACNAELNSNPHMHPKDVEDMLDTPPNKATTDAEPCIGTYVPDSFDRSYKATTRTGTEGPITNAELNSNQHTDPKDVEAMSDTPPKKATTDAEAYISTYVPDSFDRSCNVTARTGTEGHAELNSNPRTDPKYVEAMSDTPPKKATTDAEAYINTYVPDSFDRSCNVTARTGTKVLTVTNIRDDTASANIGPKKKRRVTSTSNHSSMDLAIVDHTDKTIETGVHSVIQIVSDDDITHSSSAAHMEQGTSSIATSDTSTRSDKGDDVAAILSDKFTRRRAIKLPKSLSSPSISLGMPRKKVAVSEFESELYNLATRRIGKKVKSKIIARIGRFHIDHRLFGESLRARKHVGTFLMNVFCEASNADYIEDPNLKPSKCFITSEAVDKLKSKKATVSEAAEELSEGTTGLSIDDFNMVMIPVCHSNHWWLIVANLRDHRFDVLNSCEMNSTSSSITHQISDKFREAYHIMFQKSDILDKQAFPVRVQSAPKQRTNHDCSIYVMKFLQMWDGRKIHDIRENDITIHRQKIAVYILTHRRNIETIDSVKKFIERHK